MTLGSSIFLSVLFISFILLVIKTKDVWDWKKIFVKWSIGLVSLCVFAGIFVWGIIEYNDRPKVQNSFWGVEMGDSPEDVLFKKGKPSRKYADGRVWIYKVRKNRNGHYYIFFYENKAEMIMVRGEKYFTNIQGVSIGSSLDTMLKKFDDPSNIEIGKDGLSRIYIFNDYNVEFEVKKSEVIGLTVATRKRVT